MGRIRVLSDTVANQIAAGEVVDRPASVVKELLENSLDAGSRRIRVDIEAGGRTLIRITDDGCGMVRDDAMLAFERHATSKIHSSDDLLAIATLGFRGEALPSIASVARVVLQTRALEDSAGTEIEIAGGKLLRVDDAGLPAGTTITVRDLFFNTPARRKFLKSEQTELSHVASLVTHYALANPDKHFELHSASHALLIAPPAASSRDRVFQIFGRDVFDQLIPIAAERALEHAGLPQPPPWKQAPDYRPPAPGVLRLTGLISKPELQKLNRNSIYVFINGRLVRDRLLQHSLTEAYRNILPPTSFPVVLLFLEVPPAEVDVNVHPAKTEVRFRQPSFMHDFVRDTVRIKLMHSRPAAGFLNSLHTSPQATPSLTPSAQDLRDSDAYPITPSTQGMQDSETASLMEEAERFVLSEKPLAPQAVDLPFAAGASNGPAPLNNGDAGIPADLQSRTEDASSHDFGLSALATLRPLGQLQDSFILAVNQDGLWIIDQHVAHERVLFEKLLRQRAVERVERQRLLMPLLIELLPGQMAAFSLIAEELDRNGFEAEPFGGRTLAIRAAPVGLEGKELERMLHEVLEQAGPVGASQSVGESQDIGGSQDLEKMRTRIAASIACHSAIKINTPLEPKKIEWLLAELALTEHPTSCPHGRPIVLRYSLKEIQRAFSRI